MANVEDLETPAVTIRLDRLAANIARAQARCDAAGRGNRPHIKTHKIPAIAKMQMAAGAIGITCQKLGEVETFVDAGVADDILLTFNILGLAKTDRLMALSRRVDRLAVVADNETVIAGLSDAARRHGHDVPLLVECDTGMGRNGVQSPAAALALARYAKGMPGIRFEGLMTFPNKAPGTGAFFSEALELFEKDGIEVAVRSGGGTAALARLADFPMMTEHRAGTYVYNDVLQIEAGAATLDDCALHVRATVVSRPTETRAVIDAGSKVLTRERYSVKHFGRVVDYPGAFVASLSEEHGVLDLTACEQKPKVGDTVSIVPNHCCVVSNMVDEVYGIADGRVEIVWPVAARGKVR
jgi:D-serine deaminase-like pyridoxal phosphate-dependent protein